MSAHTEITIRTARESDAPALLNIYAPYIVNTAITFEYTVPSTEEFAGRIRAFDAHSKNILTLSLNSRIKFSVMPMPVHSMNVLLTTGLLRRPSM